MRTVSLIRVGGVHALYLRGLASASARHRAAQSTARKATPSPAALKHPLPHRYTRTMYRIMTVCTGNICRSPVGEYLIRQHAQEAGVPVTVTSSGISNEEEGNRIDPRAAAQLATRGIDPSAHRASVFTVEDFDRNDLILAMDAPHYLRLKALARNDDDKAKIRMMRSFDPKVTTTHLDQLGIYDPWYGSERDFVYTTDLIDAAARGLINHLKQEGDAQ